MHVHGTAVAEVVKAPDLVQQLITGIDPVGRGSQVVQQLHLLGRGIDLLAVQGVGRRQIGDDGSILLQTGDGRVFHIAVHLELERAAQDCQRQQQNHSSRKKVPAEGCFHA